MRPPHADFALGMLNFGLTSDESELDDYLAWFEGRWGSVDEDALVRAIDSSVSHPDEHLFAVLALGRLKTERAREHLVPLLASEDRDERWAAALGLGQMRDPRALPTLTSMLAAYRPDDNDAFFWWPLTLTSLPGGWPIPEVASILRGAFLRALAEEWALPPPPPQGSGFQDQWHEYQYQ